MRYLIAIPICLILVSGGLWLLSRNAGFHTAAGESPPLSSAVKPKSGDVEAVWIPSATGSEELKPSGKIIEPIVITPCTLMPIREQEVAGQIDGLLQQINVRLGQKVSSGECLAHLDDRKIRGRIAKLEIKATSDSAELVAQALFKEADSKVKYAEQANKGGLTSVPKLEYQTYLAQRERFAQEIRKAREDRQEAQKELATANLLLELHKLESSLNGEVVKIFRKEGEIIKQAEPLFRVACMDKLRIEGFCKVSQAGKLHLGNKVLVEPHLQGAQLTELIGHTQSVTDLAISPDGELLVSAGEDKNILLWSWPSGFRLASLSLTDAVQSLQLVQPNKNQQKYLLAAAGDDHCIRIWSIGPKGLVKEPPKLLCGHTRPIRSICLSTDGKLCASGGEDRRLGLWDAATGKRLQWVHPPTAWKQFAHQGTITDVKLDTNGYLISAGSDNVVKVWKVNGAKSKLVKTHTGRSGDVEKVVFSAGPDKILFDYGDELRVLNSKTGAVLGTLRSNNNIRFKNFAGFSPTGFYTLTSSANGQLQLWRTPATPREKQKIFQAMTGSQSQTSPGHEEDNSLKQTSFLLEETKSHKRKSQLLGNIGGFEVQTYQVPKAATATCGVFAPDETVFFTGGTDGTIRVWVVPTRTESKPHHAVLTYIGSALEQGGTNLVRIQAEMKNAPPGLRRLRPGTFVTLKFYPIN